MASVTSSAEPDSSSIDSAAGGEDDPPEVRLGERLFIEKRFSSPDGDVRISCRNCHLVDEDERGMRAYADFDKWSRVPYRNGDATREVIRNSPTMLDSGRMSLLHFDGEFDSLESLVKKTLSTRNMGWLDGEEEKAFDQAYHVLLRDEGEHASAEGTYVEQFRAVYGIELNEIGRDGAIGWIAKSMSDYMRSLKTTHDSLYDEFVKENQLEEEPVAGEAIGLYAERHLLRIRMREAGGTLKMPEGFDAQALAGLKIFFTTSGAAHVGNCVACHTPPAFTDFSFHNTGVTQLEYDAVHGQGAFAGAKIPERPDERTLADRRAVSSRDEPAKMDLGYWNFADPKNSALRRRDESEAAFRNRMIAAFKTPTLRNLKFTNPYMHTGEAATLEDALGDIVHASNFARDGKLRSGDEEYALMRLDETDIMPLVAFLNVLNEKYE